jgi:hypothetical protein
VAVQIPLAAYFQSIRIFAYLFLISAPVYCHAVAVVIYAGSVLVMSSNGGRSERERNLAAQRRNAERKAREQARLAKEREKAHQQEHLHSRQRAAARKTVATERLVEALDEVLTSVLPLPQFSFAPS